MAGVHERVEIFVFSLVVTIHIKCTRQAEKFADSRSDVGKSTSYLVFPPVFELCPTIP